MNSQQFLARGDDLRRRGGAVRGRWRGRVPHRAMQTFERRRVRWVCDDGSKSPGPCCAFSSWPRKWL